MYSTLKHARKNFSIHWRYNMNAYDETLGRLADLTFKYASDTISKQNFIMAMGCIRYDIEYSNLGQTEEGQELVEAIDRAVMNEIDEVNA